jgi:hypothetical protein
MVDAGGGWGILLLFAAAFKFLAAPESICGSVYADGQSLEKSEK